MNRASTFSIAALVFAALCVSTACSKKSAPPSAESTADDSNTAAAPEIMAKEPVYSFGQVKQGQNVEHVFKIKNQGKAELLIEKARGS